MKRLVLLAIAGTSMLGGTAGLAQDVSEADIMASLEGVAPGDILANATLMAVSADGMETVREGDNGWTCMEVGANPMCADAGGAEWMHALLTKGEAPQKLGFVYMLKGDGGASNTDPFAAEETADNNWVVTGPHVMIVGAEAKSLLASYSAEAEADPTKPYVMWAGTPYEHLMLPTE
jgi:hypothetical protein